MKALSLRSIKKVALFTSVAVLAFSFGLPSMSAAPIETEKSVAFAVPPTLSANITTGYTQLGGKGAFFQAFNGPVSFSIDQTAPAQIFTVSYQIRDLNGQKVIATKTLSNKSGGSSPTGSLYFGSIGPGFYTVFAKVTGSTSANATVQVYAN